MQDMRIFAAVARHGSFTAAAQGEGLTASAVSKLITRLEARLGARLLNRTTRRVALTPEGTLYLAHCRRILDEIAFAEAEVAASGETPRGKLRINTGVAFAMHQLAPALPDFLARYPDIQPELTVTDRVVDLLSENADMAIRTGRVVDNALVMRKICDLERVICASPAYLEKHGRPQRPEELLGHECITISTLPDLSRWPFLIDGELRHLEVAGRIRVDNAETLLQLVIAGLGIFRSADNLVGEPIRRGLLVPLLTHAHYVEPVPLAAVYPQGRHHSPAVRAFVDFLVERFAHAPWRTPPEAGTATAAHRPAERMRP